MQFSGFSHNVKEAEFSSDDISTDSTVDHNRAFDISHTDPGSQLQREHAFDPKAVFIPFCEFSSFASENSAAVGQTQNGGSHVAEAGVEFHAG